MKLYSSIKEARVEARETVLKGYEIPAGFWQGTSAMSRELMLETLNYGFVAPIPNGLDTLNKECEPDQPWADNHFRERVSGLPLNPGESYKIWPYNKFKDGNDPYLIDGRFSHTYMERFWGKEDPVSNNGVAEYGDLNDLIDLFCRNIFTRQAYLPVWFPQDTGSLNNQRVPCTLGYHFFYRSNSMHVNYYIRSCDFYRHFKNDIYLTCRLAQHVMKEVCRKKPDIMYSMGYITMFITHFHVFKNDLYLLKKSGNY